MAGILISLYRTPYDSPLVGCHWNSPSCDADAHGWPGVDAEVRGCFLPDLFSGVLHKHQPLHDRINRKDCQAKKPLVIQGFSTFLGLFQVIMADPLFA